MYIFGKSDKMSDLDKLSFLRLTKPFKNVTFLIAFLTAGIYFAAFSYERGYCDEFGMKLDLISIDINSLLQFCFNLFEIGTLVLLIFAIVKSTLSQLLKHPGIYSLALMLNLVFLLFPLYLLFMGIGSVYGLPVGVGLMIITNLILFSKREDIKLKTSKELLDSFVEDFGPVIYVAPLFIVCWICLILGQGEADRQTKFQVVKDSLNYVIIRRYGDEFVCKEIDLKTKIFGAKTALFKIGDKEKINFIEMELGQLVFFNIDSLNRKTLKELDPPAKKVKKATK